MNPHRSVLVALGSCLTLAAAASADVTPIGEFTGEFSETFEAIAPPGGYPGPMSILGGAATLSDDIASTVVIASSVASADTDWVNLFPYDGFLMGLTPTGWTSFSFPTPALRFGGFIGSAAIQEGGQISFYDANGDLISTGPFTVPSLDWAWQGWEYAGGLSRIEIRGNFAPGDPLVFDNLQLTLVPAPGSLALLALGAFAAGGRRR